MSRVPIGLGALATLACACLASAASAQAPTSKVETRDAPVVIRLRPARAPEPAPSGKKPGVSVTWDANIDGGLGYAFETSGHVSGFVRARFGLMWVDERDLASPSFRMLGLAYEFSDLRPATFWLQGETLSLDSGLWAQLGAGLDVTPRPAFSLAVGASLLGVEGQVRWDREAGAFPAVFAKLRLPVGLLAFAIRERGGL